MLFWARRGHRPELISNQRTMNLTDVLDEYTYLQ